MEIRQAALCVIFKGDAFLVAELTDPVTGAVLHRPPGGGLEPGESPEEAVRREVHEELGLTLTRAELLGAVDHVWQWNGRDLRERAWLFKGWADSPPPLELVEADGSRFPLRWRSLKQTDPPLVPAALWGWLSTNVI